MTEDSLIPSHASMALREIIKRLVSSSTRVTITTSTGTKIRTIRQGDEVWHYETHVWGTK